MDHQPMQQQVGMSQGQEGRLAPAPAVCGLPPAPELAHCPICDKDLPIKTDFGVCRSRANGHNMYCKACIRAKVNASRSALREWRQRKKKLIEQQPLPLIGLAPTITRRAPLNAQIKDSNFPHAQRVLGAIRLGARTQEQILIAIRPSHCSVKPGKAFVGAEMDRIGESLATLLLDSPRKIQIDASGCYTVYSPSPTKRSGPLLSFSTVGGVVSPGPVTVTDQRSAPAARWRAA